MEEVELKLRNLQLLPKEKRFQLLGLLGAVQGNVAKRITDILIRIGRGDDVRNEVEGIDTETLLKEVESSLNSSIGIVISQTIRKIFDSHLLGKKMHAVSPSIATELLMKSLEDGIQISGNMYKNWLLSILRNPEGIDRDEYSEIESKVSALFIYSLEYDEYREYFEGLRASVQQKLYPEEGIPISATQVQRPEMHQRVMSVRISAWQARGKILGLYRFDATQAWKVALEEAEEIDFPLFSALVYVMGNDTRYEYRREDFVGALQSYNLVPQSETDARRLFRRNLKQLKCLRALLADFSQEYRWLVVLGTNIHTQDSTTHHVPTHAQNALGSDGKIYFHELLSLPETMRARIFARCTGGKVKSFLHGVMQGKIDRSMLGQSFEASELEQIHIGDSTHIFEVVENIRKLRQSSQGVFQHLQSLALQNGLSLEMLIFGISKIHNGEVTGDEIAVFIDGLPPSVFGAESQLKIKLDRVLKRFGLSIISPQRSQSQQQGNGRNEAERVSFHEALGGGLLPDLAGKLARGELYSRLGATGKKGSRKYGFQASNRLPDMDGSL